MTLSCFSFVPLIKDSQFSPSQKEIEAARINFEMLSTFNGQVISSYALLNIDSENKLIEIIAVNSNTNYLGEISKLDDLTKIFGWNLIISVSKMFGNPLI
jgi:hypothetical protein